MKTFYKKLLLVFFLFFLTYLIFPSSFDSSIKYDHHYEKWLKLVNYIITPTEKRIFISLKTNKDKDAFIKLFWKQRDPTPGTETNEYKNKIIKRFEYANKHFGRGTPKEGWQTDRGRIYIILGEPQKIEKFDSINGLYPTIVWDYYGLNLVGIPKNINIVFFRRNGFGEYVLYDPSADTPAALLSNIETTFGRYDYRKIYKKIMKIAPQLAGPAFSIIPGKNNIMIPQINNSIILTHILESPEKSVDTSYAKNFFKFKGIVNVEENYNFIKSGFIYTVLKDPVTGINFLHFSLKPKKLSFDFSYEYDKYFTALTLNVIVKNNNKTIYQYEKKYSLSFNKTDFTEKIKPMGISVDDMFPIVDGNFEITFILQNSVNKEFTYLEKKINIKTNDNILNLSIPFLTYRIIPKNRAIIRPFTINDKTMSIDSDNVFSLKDKIFLVIPLKNLRNLKHGKLKIIIKSREGYPQYMKKYDFNIEKSEGKTFFSLNINKGLFPAVFNVELYLLSKGGIPIDSKELNFTVSPLSFVAHPTEIMTGIKFEDKGLLYYRIGNFYKNMKDYKLAEFYYNKGFNKNPEIYDELINYVDFLLFLNNPEKADKIIEYLKTVKEFSYEYNAYKGKILFLKKDYQNALNYFLKSIELFDRDYNIVSLTGLCYLKLNNKKKAKIYFNNSLKINPEQPIIKKYINNQ